MQILYAIMIVNKYEKTLAAHQRELRGPLLGHGPPIENHCFRQSGSLPDPFVCDPLGSFENRTSAVEGGMIQVAVTIDIVPVDHGEGVVR